jgi:hypothetical protein
MHQLAPLEGKAIVFRFFVNSGKSVLSTFFNFDAVLALKFNSTVVNNGPSEGFKQKTYSW